MHAKELIKSSIELSHSITKAYVTDLSNDELFIRSVPGANHIAWQLGHLISSEHAMMSGVGVEMPALPAGFDDAHNMENTKSDDKSQFLTRDAYLELMGKMHEAAVNGLEATPDARLDEPSPEKFQAYAPTVGAVFAMIGAHELMHAGQYVPVRRKLEKPIAI